VAALFELAPRATGPPAVNPPLELGGAPMTPLSALPAGDRTAFGLLYARYSRMVTGSCSLAFPISLRRRSRARRFPPSLAPPHRFTRCFPLPRMARLHRPQPRHDFHRRVKANEEFDENSSSVQSDHALPPQSLLFTPAPKPMRSSMHSLAPDAYASPSFFASLKA